MQTEELNARIHPVGNDVPNWLANVSILWERRRSLVRTAGIGIAISAIVVFLIPNRYESTARIMPPESSGTSTAVLAALAGRGSGEFGGLGNLAASLLGVRTSGPLFVDLLHSGTISGALINRFDLQKVYGKRYRMDAAKKLGRATSVVEDKKSGVISITVEDADPHRARDLTQAYLSELNSLVNSTNTSSARLERMFIEHRLQSAEADLERAQKQMSDFSSTHSTIDIKEQTRATVDAAAKLQGQVIVEQSELDSLTQIYGDENIRVRAARARISNLKAQLRAIAGTSEPLLEDGTVAPDQTAVLSRTGADYPPLRQIPRLAVPYADIYRHVRVQEAVYELLTQQYELARIQEAKDVPVIRVIDAPGVPEKKFFPPRALFLVLLTLAIVIAAAGWILMRDLWDRLDQQDPRKKLLANIASDVVAHGRRFRRAPGYES
jgi:capsule polysaccharide export protein KpsE/RkpR